MHNSIRRIDLGKKKNKNTNSNSNDARLRFSFFYDVHNLKCVSRFFFFSLFVQLEVENLTYTRGNYTLYYADKTPHSCPWKCELTNDRGYVLYSALGSFYIPMLVMLFFYWRIYRAAVRTTRAINQGFKTTKGKVGYLNFILNIIFKYLLLLNDTSKQVLS